MTFQKMCVMFELDMVTIQGLLFAKNCNKRYSKTKFCILTILGEMMYEYIAHKTMEPDFNTVAMATGNRPIRKLCNIIQNLEIDIKNQAS